MSYNPNKGPKWEHKQKMEKGVHLTVGWKRRSWWREGKAAARPVSLPCQPLWPPDPLQGRDHVPTCGAGPGLQEQTKEKSISIWHSSTYSWALRGPDACPHPEQSFKQSRGLLRNQDLFSPAQKHIQCLHSCSELAISTEGSCFLELTQVPDIPGKDWSADLRRVGCHQCKWYN